MRCSLCLGNFVVSPLFARCGIQLAERAISRRRQNGNLPDASRNTITPSLSAPSDLLGPPENGTNSAFSNAIWPENERGSKGEKSGLSEADCNRHRRIVGTAGNTARLRSAANWGRLQDESGRPVHCGVPGNLRRGWPDRIKSRVGFWPQRQHQRLLLQSQLPFVQYCPLCESVAGQLQLSIDNGSERRQRDRKSI